MRRLNVQFSQIEECIRTSMFAVDMLPANPQLVRGEELLLQLVKEDARQLNKLDSRIEFALLFDTYRPDETGAISREHWPNAGKTWKYILYCSATIPTIPFSLEGLRLSKDYGGQANPMYIEPADEAIIRPYLRGGTDPHRLREIASVHDLLAALKNHDLVLRLAPVRTRVAEPHRVASSWLSDTLKALYDHRCQVCAHDFEPRYGVPYADTLPLSAIEREFPLSSKQLLVVCPNHRAVIGLARPRFNDRTLAFEFANGLVERLLLRDHLLFS